MKVFYCKNGFAAKPMHEKEPPEIVILKEFSELDENIMEYERARRR